ncbi:MAG: hypothetical protein AAF801_09875 [Pseudomonadota bacterium]
MSIIYPLTPPALGIARVRLTAENAVGYDESPFTFRGQSFEWPGARWQLEVTLPPLKPSDAKLWIAFLLSLRGQVGTFNMGDPAYQKTGSGVGIDNLQVAQIAGSSTLPCYNAPPNASGYLAAGDYVQLGLGASATLHRVLQDVNTNASGEYAIEIWPPASEDLNINRAIYLNDPVATWRLAGDSIGWDVNTARHYGISFNAVQVVP